MKLVRLNCLIFPYFENVGKKTESQLKSKFKENFGS